MNMIKAFSCAIKGSSFQKNIEIDARKCKDVTSLQEAIAEDLGISISQFKILNPPENLTKMKKFCIDIQIKKPCDDVDFVFPDQKNILIKNFKEKEFDDIISIFRDNGIFLSSRCIIKDIRFNLFGEDVLLENDIFSFIPKGTQVKVELSGNVIILKYHDIQFILSENEPIKNSISLIQEKLTGCSEISIKSLLHEEFDPETKLKKKDNNNYVIEAKQQFIFTLVEENSAKSLKLDYFTTVEEARQLLSSMHSFGIELKPKDVIIYDLKKRKVKNFDEKLINIKNDENKVYFDIPILTKFAEENEEAAPKKSKKGADSKKPKTKSDEVISIYFFFESDEDLNGDIKITVSMTIEEVKQKIADLYTIENEIHLKYKQGSEFIELDDDVKIEDVKDVIKRGKNKYKIYVESKKDEKEEEEDKKDFLNEKIDPEVISKLYGSKIKNEYEKLKKENQEIKKMNEEMGKEVELIKSSNKKLEKENQTINKAYNELKEDFEKIETENKSLQHQISDLKSKKVTPKSEIKPIQPLEVESIENLKNKILIGEGGQSRVYRVTREEYYVLKELKTNNSSEDFKHFRRLLQEFEIINMLQHKNIIQTYGICVGDETHPPLLLLEFCPRNLKQAIIDQLSDMKKVTIIYEISLAMNEIHKLRIIHRDLKPENILLDAQDHVKLSDFGISYVSEDSLSSKTLGLGTLKFMAPEILNENPHYDEKIDVYSFGVVVFFILTNGDLPRINLVEVGNGKKAPIPKNINEISKELILRCWSTDPKDRPSFNEIIEYITNHQFKMIDGIESEISQIMKFLSI